MMSKRRYCGVRYRLAHRARFEFILMVSVSLVIALIFITIGLSLRSKPAAAKVDPPVSALPTNARSSAPPAGAVANAGKQFIAEHGKQQNTVHQDDWRLPLVDEMHPLPKGFHVETKSLPNGLQFDARAFDDLTRMISDGESQGLNFVVCSAYRTVTKQQELYNHQVQLELDHGETQKQAEDTAKTKVALPGASEHNLGLAVDIVALSYQELDEGYLNTKECKWLQANSYKYGFIMRYPADKSSITKIIFEPWHYRYIGVEAAKEITEKGLCLEEYLGVAD